MYITRQSQLRQKSRQIKTYLVVIYGNAYTPCWPAAEQQQLSSASFRFICLHNSRPFVCTAVRLSVCLLLAFLSLLFPSFLPLPYLTPLLLGHSLFVYVRVVGVAAAVVPVHTPCSAQHSHSHKSKEISAISKLFFTRHFSVFL